MVARQRFAGKCASVAVSQTLQAAAFRASRRRSHSAVWFQLVKIRLTNITGFGLVDPRRRQSTMWLLPTIGARGESARATQTHSVLNHGNRPLQPVGGRLRRDRARE